jgi:serine phosphatase RsbU (regulator of sigma subunit)
MPSAATQQLDELLKDATRLRNTDPPRSLALGLQARALAGEMQDDILLVRAFISIALTYQGLSRFTEALSELQAAYDLAVRTKDELCLSDVCSGYGNVYYYLGDYDSSLRYHLEALRLREKHTDERRIAFTINSVGVVYATMKNFPLAEDYFFRSLEMNKKLDDGFGLRMARNNIGKIYNEQKRSAEAITVLTEALPGAENLHNDTIQCELLINLGDACRDHGDLEQSHTHFRNVLTILAGRHNIAEAKALEGMARLHQVMGNIREARELARAAITLYEKLSLKSQVAALYRLLAAIEKQAGNPDVAAQYTERYIELAEEQHDEELVKKTRNLTLAFEAENLKKENEINYLRNVELRQAYDQVHEKNSQLIDSIQYARYFQDLVFAPYRALLSLCLKNSFLFTRPKDIVSGDFFWCYADSKNILLVLADCTGHGVPGAFVSILGNSLLNTAVHEKKILHPTGILQFLNTKFCEMDSREGMDLTIVHIGKLAGTITYAGINAGLVLVKQNGSLTAYKGSGHLIGKDHGSAFTSETTAFQPGDTLYLFTDGLHTQKGGEHGKKLLRSAFLQWLTELSAHPLKEQEELLAQRFETWKGGHEQQDDVTVAGMRL